MDDLESSFTESATMDVAQPAESQPQEVQEQPIQKSNDAEQSRSNRAFRELRLQKEEAERKARMQEELIARLLANQQAVTPPTPEANPLDELNNYRDDDFIPASVVKRSVAAMDKIAERKALEAVDRRFQEREKADPFGKLRAKYSDFDDVVNPETLGLLEEHDPDLAKELADLKDPYKIGMLSYKNIKALGLVEPSPTQRRVKEVEKKIEQNQKSVQTPLAYDKRPLASTLPTSKAERESIFKEMMGYASQAGFGY